MKTFERLSSPNRLLSVNVWAVGRYGSPHPGPLPEERGSRGLVPFTMLWMLTASLMVFAQSGWADQVEMANGDHYAGKVLSLNSNMVTFQSDVLGTVQLPRSSVAGITFGSTSAGVTPARRATVSSTNAAANVSPNAALESNAEISTALKQLGANTNFIQKVQQQFLAGASPEANAKFNEMVGGLMSGKLSMSDLRAEAKSAADQLRAARKEMGPEGSEALDGYLAILDSFLGETASLPKAKTNSPALNRPRIENE